MLDRGQPSSKRNGEDQPNREDIIRLTDAVERLGSLLGQLLQRLDSSLPPSAANLLTPGAAAEELEVSRKTVLQLLTSGILIGSKVGRQWRVERVELERYRARIKQLQPAPTAPRGRQAPRSRTARAVYEDRPWR